MTVGATVDTGVFTKRSASAVGNRRNPHMIATIKGKVKTRIARRNMKSGGRLPQVNRTSAGQSNPALAPDGSTTSNN